VRHAPCSLGWGIAAFALVSSWVCVARAEPSSWLGWSAPDECQNTSEVERRLQSLLGHPVDSASLPPTRVRLGWSAERGWAVRVTVELAEGARDRAVDAPSCADAFDVVALSLALILDPSFGAQSPAPSADTPPDAAPGADALALPSAFGPEPAASGRSSPLPAGIDARALDTTIAPAATRGLAISIAGGALTDLDVFPVPQFGGGLQLWLGSGRLRVELEGDALASESTLFAGARYPVSFRSFTAGLRGCYALDLSEGLSWLACAGAELGELGAHERGGESRRSGALWVAAEAASGPEVTVTGWLRAFARIRGVSPLVRHEFLLSEGTSVHTLPWLSPQLQVGISIALTDLGAEGH
jgi:hypothetical protein